MFSETDMAAMQTLRKSIDPDELANRGKMFPGDMSETFVSTGMHPLERAGIISRE
jgi:glycolate oxidase